MLNMETNFIKILLIVLLTLASQNIALSQFEDSLDTQLGHNQRKNRITIDEGLSPFIVRDMDGRHTHPYG